MKIDNNIPFYSNTPDDTHCFQACLKMIIEYYWPDRVYSWEELDKITSKVEGLWTWPMAGLIYMQEQGIDVKVLEMFDYDRFIERGGEYIIEEYGEEVGNSQIIHSDIEQERRIAQKYIQVVNIEKRIACKKDIVDFLRKGYLIIANINAKVINNKPGYSGHFIVVKGIDNDEFIINDPGLPALENRLVNFELFEKAWSYPDENAKDLIAFKLR